MGKFGRRPPLARTDLVHELPRRRSIAGSLIPGAFLIVFTLPLFQVADFVDGPVDDLFDIVIVLFTGFWMLGWSVGLMFLAVLFLQSLVGRERLILKQGELLLRDELFGFGVTRQFDGDAIQDVKRVDTASGQSFAWRGPHLQFTTGEQTVAFGSEIDNRTAELIIADIIERVLIPASRRPRPHEAAPVRIAPHAAGDQRDLSLPLVALIAANLVPVGGVLLFDWRVGDVMLLYWAESAIIGVLNLAKMWCIAGAPALLMGIFFLGHYGGFMAGHLLFIYAFMIDGETGGSMALADVLNDFMALLPAFLALVVSHGLSYVRNFLGRREYEGKNLGQQMSEPYRRIIVMHMTIILGGFLVMALDHALPALLLMIALKIGTDLRAHLKEHTSQRSTNET